MSAPPHSPDNQFPATAPLPGATVSGPPLEIAVAFVDQAATICHANAAFYTAIQASPESKLSVAKHLVADYPNQQKDIEAVFAASTSAQLHLRETDKRALQLLVHATEAGQRLIQATNVADGNQDTVYTDPLTGLGNRRLLDRILKESRQSSKLLAMIMMDLDRFKQINDTLGHGIGDKLLQLVAKRMKRTTRAKDITVRLGGDEFIILHEAGDNTNQSAKDIAARLVDVMARPFLVDGHQLNIGASIGISTLNDNTHSVDDLMRHADLALYAAKNAGRGNYLVFTESMEQKAIARRDLEIHLRRALRMKEFELVYQPQVDMPAGELTGFEALIRWNSSFRGMVPPDDFIPVAEETGEIIAIGSWVLETACREAASWNNHLAVAVNVSPVQFLTDTFVDTISRALLNSGLAPERLEIEITESILISKPEKAHQQLTTIRDMGVGIAMDDFGTGYSSLSYLNNFPISKIKIDRAFVSTEQTPKTKALVDAIITLGASLGMKTLAEGVETAEQFSQLSSSGCIAAQGYHISRPLKAQDLDHFVNEHTASQSASRTSR